MQGQTTRSRLFLLLCFLTLFFPDRSGAEWYAGGYGGYSFPSMPGGLGDVTLPAWGEQQAEAAFPQYNPVAGDTLSSSMNASNVSLKNSAIFGGKVGYFFSAEGLSWLGVEVEAFTSTPSIKKQTLATQLEATYSPKVVTPPLNVPQTIRQTSSLQLEESDMRLITVAFNVVARYPGKVFQPYAGVGAGAFYFSSSGQIDGHQVVPGFNALAGVRVLMTEEWGFFVEGKYNLATISNLDPTYGLSGQYSAFNAVAGLAYHF